MGIPEGEEKEKRTGEISEATMVANFPTLMSNHRSRKLREYQAGIMPKTKQNKTNKSRE